MVIHVYAVLVPLLLAVSAFFAAAEAALFALTRTQLEGMRTSRPAIHRRICALLDRPEALLSTLVVGNELLNVFTGTFVATLMALQFSGDSPVRILITSVLVSSLLLLTFSEILPKSLAFRWPVQTASFVVYPMAAAQLVLGPVRRVFEAVAQGLLVPFGVRTSAVESSLSEKDLLTLVEEGAKSGSLDREEKEMIFNVFQFHDLTVSALMTPWSKVFSLPDSLTPDEVLAQVRRRGFSRVPVISAKTREVTGILYTKELLKLLLARPGSQAEVLEQAISPPYIVSTHKKISRLFREFKAKKVHFALVVDEYGNHLGVVTLEDVLSAIFLQQHHRQRRAPREALG